MWDARSCFSGAARVSNLALRLTPRDAFRLGVSVTSAPFAFGNNPPVVTAVLVGSGASVSGTVPIAFRVFDDEEPVDVVRVALRQGDVVTPIDGRVDLAAARPTSALQPLLRLFVNDGAGGFAESLDVPEFANEVRTHVTDVAAVDFGGDRGPDMLSTCRSMTHSATRRCPAARYTPSLGR